MSKIPVGRTVPTVEQLEFPLYKHQFGWLYFCFLRKQDHAPVVPCAERRECRRMVHQGSTPETEKPLTVLLIDDDGEDRAYWSALLKKPPIGFLVLEAACGESGFKLWQNQSLDCVVLDVEMPESGLFTLLRLIPDPTRRHVPVVILTKLAQPALIKLMKSLGAYECLVKEYCSGEKLAQTIRQAIAFVKSERAV